MRQPDVGPALRAGESVRGTTSPNPPVGCALYRPDGALIATGATSPAGGPHAEVNALRRAGSAARGAIAVVTLEPCNHTGRTGPCAEALAEAGVVEVIYLTEDPNPLAAGGADYLRSRGIEATFAPRRVKALDPWLSSVRHGRVSVTVKFAASIDGFTAAPDGTSQWITGPAAREHVHADRAARDAIVIGTGTAIADNPSLTARLPDGTLRRHQPRRVVVGTRDVPAGNLSRLGYERYGTPEEALEALWDTGARDVLVEGGASLAASFIELGVVDRVQAYLAPLLLGGGTGVLARALAPSLSAAPRYQLVDTATLGEDVLIEMEKECLQG
ncbi:bifunctional diaminohydroxyphosphoribosylaminopyrimidine deaminase/5-amino-6-(5-phosphoribosylamino)uracil reductase RibD [Corynebacterium liangguodongii]|uniref:Riboflavin biosynthesis protein RibD n=1 Tax=Corynebacterium liangguodongii TaxID=2079535 RepID=A0A2S0WE56_9CORY|nr:bifunctional diaminohydroxyphosphoribosylaminopyrimidine deaminase/5-amino-6-(5-phosphoribosylamino)uracil reductase RibD [Corynebacterium liangguodongii]AWB84065.1 bifunctional diaminohydroxyphosphoribosylaminopyrimidine deaminase/5-amino-6-(5-phosphoribosylamino)uracil reductase RibD [Corynebacterium liangguodongii]PWC00076.1 bifunctional diaminohydroxyphosphoribosylaminopyrimidine deaminase/5-amino-6-(5-phosphoribosylamino)uracil reductase RibD [Corynebacterium liangguodongii]